MTMYKKAELILTDGRVLPMHTKWLDLEAMYAAIGNGCDIVEPVYLRDGRIMWVDEMAKIRGREMVVNWKATKLLAEAGGIVGDVVVGNVIITEGFPDENEVEG